MSSYVQANKHNVRMNFYSILNQSLISFVGMGCGGTLYDTRGVVTSPNFPRPYTQQSNCEWTLKVPPGQKIQLRFSCKEKLQTLICILIGTYVHISELILIDCEYH